MKLTKQFLIKEYKINKKSAYQIAEETGYGSSTIWRHLKSNNIKIRSLSEAHADFSGKNNPFFGKQHNKQTKKKMKNNHADFSEKNNPMFGKRGVETGNYIDGRRSNRIYYCKKCKNIICYHTSKYGSGLCGSCSAGGTGIPGENTEYGAEFDNALKEQVRFRDHYKCRECGCSQLENGKQLDCHHIDYIKRNNFLNNLVSLCMGCHRKTNHNRKFWKEHFKVKETA